VLVLTASLRGAGSGGEERGKFNKGLLKHIISMIFSYLPLSFAGGEDVKSYS
jgi:hypothetical protein